ncbi:uncharacterized protein LOC129578285 [Sitodiplosis mosellana]|uniref:uncharacterized protein LOC129578285 n=1 Tax=Sitodiplosis mosellana TaxID=263140 RepID=UPI0024443E53|nr:uncharacterized protein LOC129578285 [Sitodiplosis mosellana]
MSHSNLDEPANKHSKLSDETEESQPQIDSLLILNNDCLHAVFEHLNIESLCNVANVCKRFRPITEQVFRCCHTSVHFSKYNTKISVLRRALYKFGHLITDFSCISRYDYNHFDAVIKFCSNNLEKLSLYNAEITSEGLETLMPRLKYLKLYECRFDYHLYSHDLSGVFSNCPELEVLIFDMLDEDGDEKCTFLKRHFPKLKQLEFECVKVNPDDLREILGLNPQLKRLHTMTFTNDEFIDAIAEYTKDLEVLEISGGRGYVKQRDQSAEGLLRLGALKKLKKLFLNISSYKKYRVHRLANEFSKKNIPIETLELTACSIISKDFISLTNLKTLQRVYLAKVERATDADLITLATELPLLSNLTLSFEYTKEIKITANGLASMIELGKRLKYIGFNGFHQVQLNEAAYELWLKLARSSGREETLVIKMDKYGETSFIVPSHILQENEAQLKIICGRDVSPWSAEKADVQLDSDSDSDLNWYSDSDAESEPDSESSSESESATE